MSTNTNTNTNTNATTTVKGHSLQDPFLNALRRQRVPVNIYLTNGIKLQGHVAAFDQYVVLLKNNTKQMVFKHAVATIVPSRNVIWHDMEDDEQQVQIPEEIDDYS